MQCFISLYFANNEKLLTFFFSYVPWLIFGTRFGPHLDSAISFLSYSKGQAGDQANLDLAFLRKSQW